MNLACNPHLRPTGLRHSLKGRKIDDNELSSRRSVIRSKESQPMRHVANLAVAGLFAFASSTFAQAPAQVYVPTQPTLMWASASANSNGGISLRIRTVQYTNGVQEYKV